MTRYTATWLALFRIFSGAVWLSYGLDKFRRPFMPPKGYMIDFVQKAAHNTTGLYHDYLVNIVLPHATVFAELSRWGEVLVATSLLLGFCTRIGGIGGVLLAMNYMPGNYAFFQYQVPLLQLPDAAMLAMSAISALLPTGAVFGVDGILQAIRTKQPYPVPHFLPDP